MIDVEQWNAVIAEHRTLVHAELKVDELRRSLRLSLRFARGDVFRTSLDLLDQVEFEFVDVSGMTMTVAGMGSLVLPALRVRDVRELGWEDVRFEVVDMEQSETIFFRCSEVTMRVWEVTR